MTMPAQYIPSDRQRLAGLTRDAATDKQLAFLTRLAAERGIEVAKTSTPLNRHAASQMIDTMLKMPRASAPRAVTVTEPGMYRDDAGTLFKVQASKDSGNLYAKRLTPIGGRRLTEDDAVVGWEFQYAQGAVYSLRADQRLTLEDAKAFGIRYGVCCYCGRRLKDAASVAAGIGPICAGKL